MNNFVQPGDVITCTAPEDGVVSGGFYLIGALLVVAATTEAEGDPFEGKTTGVYTGTKATGSAWTEGQSIYWDDTAKKFTHVAAGNTFVGTAVVAALTGDTTGSVRLNGSPAELAAASGVGTEDLADGSVTTAKLAAGAVTAAKAAVFVSAEQTATGAAQNVAHGLGVVPSKVVVSLTEHPGVPDTGAFDIAEGTHTTTNVVLTVTVNCKFKVLAWA